MKKIAVIGLLAVFLLCISSCSAEMRNKLMGEWTLTGVNGAGLEQYAAAMGRNVSDVAVNYTFYEDMAVENTANGENELPLEWSKDGVITEPYCFFAYNAEKDVLTVDDGEHVMVYTRGLYDFD